MTTITITVDVVRPEDADLVKLRLRESVWDLKILGRAAITSVTVEGINE